MTSTHVTNQILYDKGQDKNESNYIDIGLNMTKFEVNVTPHMIEDMNILVEFCQTYFLSKDLKQYRPHRRPLTNVPAHLKNDPVIKRKRKLIVR